MKKDTNRGQAGKGDQFLPFGRSARQNSGTDEGEKPGFALLFEQHQSELIRYLYSMVGEVESAQDLAQETFVRGYKVWLEKQGLEEVRWRPLLYKIATNCALDLLRKRKKVGANRWGGLDNNTGSQGELIETAGAANQADPATHLEIRLSIVQTLHHLEPEAATCLLLHYDQGFSCAEIASITGSSQEAIWQRLSRARRQFRLLYLKEQNQDA